MQKIIEGVPLLRQKPFWCGYTCMSMLLRYWGYDYSPDDVFEKAYVENYGQPEDSRKYTIDASIGIGNLALAAQGLTHMRVDLIDQSKHDQLQAKKPGITEQDVLRSYLAKDIPCLVRLPHHYNVAIGFETESSSHDTDFFTFNETSGSRQERNARYFESLWSDHDPSMTYDTRHLLLALRPE